MDQVLLALTKTIHIFFNTVETSDLARLRCDSNDPEWRRFSDALATLRKAVGLQILNISNAYDIDLSPDLKGLVRYDEAS